MAVNKKLDRLELGEHLTVDDCLKLYEEEGLIGLVEKVRDIAKKQERAEKNAYRVLQNTAVRACKSINPDNPMAVAESIADLYEALKYIIRELDKADIIKLDSIFMIMPNKILAKVEGK